MSRTTSHNLTVTAYRLSRSAPTEWDNFMAAMAAHTAAQCEDACKADVALALTAHGRAQAMISLRDFLQEIEAKYLALETKAKSR